MYRISQVDLGSESFVLVVPLGKNRFSEVIMLGVSKSEREELRLEIVLRESHLSRGWITLALMLILED